ncbi:transcriptional regulator Spx [Marinococcus sp. PL1-022]|uniref:transcriptional regulator Spx n=1 Tax=Marinococcus sp. PL1-022 TaxID=3095363 RepID=UPI0029C341D8|nr:transcriptional regulator Spx [Marinococcus sp. PL1-022]MDX6152702.1 transcriptional regulator Spx [Marinococcus sp. PL1-022]
MVTLLTAPGRASCQKAKKWLQDHCIPFQERNILAHPLSVHEVKEIFRKTEKGTDDIVATRSKDFQALNIDWNTLTMQELFQLMSKYPGLVRKPLLYDDNHLQVGYSNEDMRQFIPKSTRSSYLQEAKTRLLAKEAPNG